jgi:hypothetical protein
MKTVRGRRYTAQGESGIAVDPRTARAAGIATHQTQAVLRTDDGKLIVVDRKSLSLDLPNFTEEETCEG